MFGKPCFRTFPKFSKLFDPKTRFCNPKTENFIRTFFAKFLRVKKTQLFPKNFRTSKNKLFRNSRKQKVRKFLSNAGPYFKYIISLNFKKCQKNGRIAESFYFFQTIKKKSKMQPYNKAAFS